jgi:hypothetical protein
LPNIERARVPLDGSDHSHFAALEAGTSRAL